MPQTTTIGLENIDPAQYMLKGGAYSTGSINFQAADLNEIGDARYLIPLKSNVKLKSIHLTSDSDFALNVTFTLTLKVGRRSQEDEGSRNIRYGDTPKILTLFSGIRLWNNPAITDSQVYTGDNVNYLYQLCGYTTDPNCLFYPYLSAEMAYPFSPVNRNLTLTFGVDL